MLAAAIVLAAGSTVVAVIVTPEPAEGRTRNACTHGSLRVDGRPALFRGAYDPPGRMVDHQHILDVYGPGNKIRERRLIDCDDHGRPVMDAIIPGRQLATR